MDEVSSNGFDLHIGIQQIKYEIPNNFKYTKFCSIKPGKLFQSNYFQMTNLIAVGTTDGPILICTENHSLLSQVCLLCAHTSPITDIIQMPNNYFVSSSRDGTLVKWSNDDGSFIKSFPQVAQKGEILLSHYHSNPNYLWVNTVGFSAILYDLKNGIKVLNFDTFGITKISYLIPDKCFYVASPILAILKFNSFSIYTDSSIQSYDASSNQPPKPIHSFPINANDGYKFFLSEYGIIRTKERQWELLSPLTFNDTYKRTVKGRVHGDFISNIKFFNQSIFCVSTYGSRFVIYFADIVNNYGTGEIRSVNTIKVISPIESICADFLFFSINSSSSAFDKILHDSKKNKIEKAQSANAIIFNDANIPIDDYASSMESFNPIFSNIDIDDFRIIYSPKPKKILSLKANRTFLETFYNNRPKLYHVPRASSARVVETDGGCAFYVRNWEKGANPSPKHVASSRITSIASRESQKLKLEIIVGCKDGTISFFSENTKKPFHTEVVLSSPVIGLAHLPFKYRGRPTLLAIGEDGSAALLKNNSVIMLFANFYMKVVSAYYHKIDECIILQRIDESFIVFKIDEPGPVLFTSALPKDSMLIWSSNEMQNETGVFNNSYYNAIYDKIEIGSESSLLTNEVRFGRNSWFYASVGISKFLNVQQRRYKLFAKFINHLFQQKTDEAFPHSHSLCFSSNNMSELSQSNSNSNTIVNDDDFDSSSDSDFDTNVKKELGNDTNSNSNNDNSNSNASQNSKREKIKFSNLHPLSTKVSDSSFSSSSKSTSKPPLPLPSAPKLASTSPLLSSPSPPPSPYAFSEFPKSQSIQSIIDWLSPEKPSVKLRHSMNPLKKIIQGLSLVIVGDNKKKATFFYPEYRICGSMAFILSDTNSVTNMIIKALISGETAEEQYPELIPAFSKLLVCGNYNIETAASIECDILIDLITDEITDKLIQTIPENSNSESHLFVLSIVAISHHYLIPKKKYLQLLSFLISKIMTNQGCSSLALSILVRGFEFWSNVNSNSNWNGKVNLFVKLVDSFVKIERPKSIEDKFFKTVIENLDTFFEGMRRTIEMNINLIDKDNELIKKFIDLMSKVAFSNPQACGIQITTNLVEIASQFNQVASLIEDEIGTHSIFFSSVAIQNNCIVIGRKNGFISVYKNFKLISSEQIFNSSVDYVSIGPTGLFCAAISVNERKAVIFALPSQGLMNSFHKRSGSEANLESVGKHYKIYWSDPTHCYFSVVD